MHLLFKKYMMWFVILQGCIRICFFCSVCWNNKNKIT